MWIKICANTSLEDAQLAAQLGADAVGFVFAPSARQVTPEIVARITPHLPPHVERIGVFTEIKPAEIARTAEQCRLTAVQLHGAVTPSLLEQLYTLLNGRIGVIQTVQWPVAPVRFIEASPDATAAVAQQLRNIAAQGFADRVLIDSKVGSAIGGTGIPFDWNAARAVLSEAGKGLHLIVAGGLHPHNIAQAIARLTPWGVDVATGVEFSPGRKSPEKLAAFLTAARQATSSTV